MTASTGRLSGRAFERLLERLGPDRQAAGHEYEMIRRKLLDFFDRRGVPLPDALADETLDRVARRIDEGEAVEHLRPYCYGVGRRILLEWKKRRAKEAASLEGFPATSPAPEPAETLEARIACLERCLEELPRASRELIVGYYEGKGAAHLEGRRLLAERLSLTYSTLKTRAHRIRAQLEECLHRCLENLGNQ